MARNRFRNVLAKLLPSKKWRGWVYTSFCKQNPIERPQNKHYPEIYNKDGQRMHLLYFQDKRTEMYGGYSKYILWDRFNYALENHFYTQKAIMRTIGHPVRKYAWLGESEAVTPDDFKLFDLWPGLAEEFNLIFTHSARILDKYPNARFTFPTPLWYDELLTDKAYEFKTKNVSIVSSDKNFSKEHAFRLAVAQRCKRLGLADTFGTFDGGSFVSLSRSLKNYRFSIAIENFITPYFFTERITSCFASMTIPIYYGAPKIGDYFNMDGIIVIPEMNIEALEKIIAQCTPEEYEARLEAVKDNYNRVQKFKCPEDYMWEEYLCYEGIE